MKYIYTKTPIEKAAAFTADKIISHLNKKVCVLWLLSGGSSLLIAVEVSKKLAGIDLSKLFVTMTDERYGEIGHKDENWQHLINAGMDLPGANLYRPLIGKGIEQTTEEFNNWLADKLQNTDYKFGIFGIGNDGHTAGIKPRSTAVTSTNLATFLTGDDFERITITFNTIMQIDEGVIQVSGSDKRSVIKDIINKTLPLHDQPAQILKIIPGIVLYTNNPREKF